MQKNFNHGEFRNIFNIYTILNHILLPKQPTFSFKTSKVEKRIFFIRDLVAYCKISKVLKALLL